METVSKTVQESCQHEYGTYKNGRNCLHCADCGVELDMITRKPIEKVERKAVDNET